MMFVRLARLLFAIAACSGALAPVGVGPLAIGRAEAQTRASRATQARARAHFEAGERLVAERRFDEAYREFESGYALSERALFLFNMAECARESGQTSQARIDYARYLAADPQGSHAEVAHERLAILGPEPERTTTATVTEPIVSPPPGHALPPLGVPDVAFEADEAPQERSLEVWEDWPFWTIVGVVVVGAAVGTTVAVLTTSGDGSAACNAGCVSVDWR
jgi:tetratricopeptide (TPR) repeat protein